MGYFSLADNPPYDDTSVKADISALQTGKVDKVDGMSLIEDAEKQRLSTVANYDDTEIKADIAKCATKDVATTTKNGLMSATDKKKLNGLATVATFKKRFYYAEDDALTKYGGNIIVWQESNATPGGGSATHAK